MQHGLVVGDREGLRQQKSAGKKNMTIHCRLCLHVAKRSVNLHRKCVCPTTVPGASLQGKKHGSLARLKHGISPIKCFRLLEARHELKCHS